MAHADLTTRSILELGVRYHEDRKLRVIPLQMRPLVFQGANHPLGCPGGRRLSRASLEVVRGAQGSNPYNVVAQLARLAAIFTDCGASPFNPARHPPHVVVPVAEIDAQAPELFLDLDNHNRVGATLVA